MRRGAGWSLFEPTPRSGGRREAGKREQSQTEARQTEKWQTEKRPRRLPEVGWPDRLRPTRGYILLSVDTLRADHLSAYGYGRETSPFLHSLTDRPGVLFEQAWAPYPSTLPSHVTMLTGYGPTEHGVRPPSGVLAPAIPTAAERFRDAGFRTAGFTEGGFVAGGFGFSRGFEQFDDEDYRDDRDVERTFGHGVRFLEGLEESERFFLFLHTYSVHDPYTPPAGHRAHFRDSADLPERLPDGPLLSAFNRGTAELSPGEVEDFEALYDGGIRYFDGVLAHFFADLTRLALLEDVTIVITSDHGEEFLEHGRVAHTQLYPETLTVPLLILHPDLPIGGRVRRLVELTSTTPTLWDLARIAVPSVLQEREPRPTSALSRQ